jgi:PGF-CTERM protein
VKLVSGSNNCTANGRNTTANYIWANVTHLCDFGVGGSAPAGSSSSSGGGGGGAYPPGWFGTLTPTVTATAPPPGERERELEHVTSTSTKAKPAASKATASAAEGTTAGDAKKGAPGFTAVFAIAGMLALAYVMMRRRG